MPTSGLEKPDAIDLCIAKLLASASDTQDELDQTIPNNVKIKEMPPSETGFVAWSRQEDMIIDEVADKNRGIADWVIPEGATNVTPRILYCHGGGYEFYSPQDVYRPTTSKLAASTGMPVFAFDYRLIPEFRHPAQLDDAVAAFKFIAKNGPEGPGDARAIFIAGDSAGGGLALALTVYLRDHPVEGAKVAGVCAASPETDLACEGESYLTRRWKEGGGHQCDPMFRDEDPAASSLPQIHKLLGAPGDEGSIHPKDPKCYISVKHTELHDLPPILIIVGDAEVMLSDSVDFGERAKEAGSDVKVSVYHRMWHTFMQFSEGCGAPDAAPLQPALDAQKEQADFFKGLQDKLLKKS